MGAAITRLIDPKPASALGAVEVWVARQFSASGLSWLAFADPDGAVGLVPTGPGSDACPALLVAEQASGYGVTVCDPAAPEELGPFATIEDALSSIGRWMACWMTMASTIDDLGTARAVAA